VRIVASTANAGIPGGRNLGAAAATRPLLAFLDDDAWYLDDDVLGRAAAAFAARPRLGVLALRIVDADGVTARRHVPRLGARDPARSGPVTAFLGGAAVVRRDAFDDVDGYPAAFFYAMEETDLSWRLVDRGWSLYYDGRPAVEHPATVPSRHAGHAERTMRNRVWMVHRCLPWPLAITYVLAWTAVTAARAPSSVPTLVGAIRAAWPDRPGPRRPIRWATVWRLTRLGRPPVV
jgi:GT2 family glycosyltransferase